ncbi:MAG: cyanophycin synthetase [Verrucomicrobia bacterium]|nr:cyanophycin synthetase [Verrucomicrobiota bacterium]
MPDLDIHEIHMLRGPNRWAKHPVLEACVGFGNPHLATAEDLPEFNGRLKSWLPGLIRHPCRKDQHRGFFECLDSGTCPAHILERVTLELQTLAGHRGNYGNAQPTCVAGLFKVIVGFVDESVAVACLHSARALLLAAYRAETFEVEAEIERLRDVVDSEALGPSTAALVDAASERGIPWRRLQHGRSLIQLGHGVKQRRIWTAETDRTGVIAEYIAKDKDLTRSTLRQAGVPVPTGRIVSDADDAWEAAQDLGLPVVVKPRDANHGRGVFLDMKTRQQIGEVFPHAAKYGDGVIVERFIPGTDHRLLVVGNRMVAASRGEPAIIVGDGQQTVHELVESQLNMDPRRGSHDTAPWSKIDTVDWDPTVMADLRKQGHTITSVPRKGERVLVSRFANPAVDVTDEVHPSISEHVVVAAKTAGLDICGVDVVCRDISRPLEEQGGAIVEINASPGLHVHLEPAVGKGRPVGAAIIEMMFPAGNNGRIPVLGVTGTRGKTSTVRLIAHLLRASGKFLAVSSTDGLQFGPRRSVPAHGESIEGTAGVLLHPWTEIAVCEASAEQILRAGLGFDRCQIGVVLNVGTDALDLTHLDTLEQLAKVKRCVVDSVMPGGTAILNADDALVAPMAEHCQGGVIHFTREPANAVVMAHRAQGGRVVLVRDGGIQLVEGSAERRLCALGDVAGQSDGRRDVPLETVLAAVGAAWAFGLADGSIRQGLRHFAAAP